MFFLLLPLVILAIGVISLVSYATSMEKPEPRTIWFAQLLTLLFGLLAQIFSEATNPLVYLHGGLLNDSLTQALSLFIFICAYFYVMSRFSDRYKISIHVTVLTLAAVFFADFAVQSNRIFFTVIAILGMILTSQAALLNESPSIFKTQISIGMIRKGFIFLILSTLVVAFCVLAFGETQLDEIQIFLSRTKDPLDQVGLVQWIVLIGASLVGGFLPFWGMFGNSRQKSDWAASVFFTTLFLIVTLQIFLKDGIFIFTRVSMGAKELEELAGVHLLTSLRIVASVGLIVTPVLALAAKNLRRSLLIFAVEPVLQIIFALSFGEKEIMSYAMGALPNLVLALGLMGFTLKTLNMQPNDEVKDWMGVGRKNSILSVMFLSSLWALAGYAPFYTGRLVQKTLCINSGYTTVLAVSFFLAGCYALRLSVLAFQKTNDEGESSSSPHKFESFFASIQFAVLILMGIFWQPLYKYGAYTIRHLFGEF